MRGEEMEGQAFKARYNEGLQVRVRQRLQYLKQVKKVKISIFTRATGISHSMLSLFIKGERNLSRNNLEKVIKVLKIFQNYI
jgi:hypothetical protein